MLLLLLFNLRVTSPPCRLFSSSSVEGIVKDLQADGSEFARKQAEVPPPPPVLLGWSQGIIWASSVLVSNR